MSDLTKDEIDNIILANTYFIKCQLDNRQCEKTQTAKKYLLQKIKKILAKVSLTRN